jgi:hypothetical protein
MQVGSTLPADPGTACTAELKLPSAVTKINPTPAVKDRLAL